MEKVGNPCGEGPTGVIKETITSFYPSCEEGAIGLSRFRAGKGH